MEPAGAEDRWSLGWSPLDRKTRGGRGARLRALIMRKEISVSPMVDGPLGFFRLLLLLLLLLLMLLLLLLYCVGTARVACSGSGGHEFLHALPAQCVHNHNHPEIVEVSTTAATHYIFLIHVTLHQTMPTTRLFGRVIFILLFLSPWELRVSSFFFVYAAIFLLVLFTFCPSWARRGAACCSHAEAAHSVQHVR